MLKLRECTNKRKVISLSNIAFMAIMVVVIAFMVLAFSFNVILQVESKPLHALSPTGITNLASGQGLVVGKNRLRLGNIASQSLSGSQASEGGQATQSITVNDSQMPDLHLSGSLHTNKGKGREFDIMHPLTPTWDAKHSNNAIIKNNGTGDEKGLEFQTYPQGNKATRKATSNIELSSAISLSPSLQKYMIDPMLNVFVNIEINTIAIDGANSFYMPISLVANSTEGNKQQSATLNVRGSSSLSMMESLSMPTYCNFLKFTISGMYHNSAYDGGSHRLSTEDYTASGICLNIESIFITVEIKPIDGLGFPPLNANNGEVSVNGIDRDERCDWSIVKVGDIIDISTRCRTNTETFNLTYNVSTNKHYVQSGAINVESSFRDYYITGNNTSSYSTIEWQYNTNYLERIYDNFDITGQTARFRVVYLEPSVAISLEFTPYLRSMDTSNPDLVNMLTNTYTTYVKLRSDALVPYEPQIDNTDNFFINNYVNKEWYTQKFIDTPERRGVEIDLKLQALSFESSGGAPIKIYYTTNGENPITSQSKALLWDEVDKPTTAPNVKLFFPFEGSIRLKTFTLKLVSYDFVGNISGVVTYEDLRFDCTDYAVNVYFMQGEKVGSTLGNDSRVSQFGAVELGAMQNGTVKYSGTNLLAQKTYRRGEILYIRLTLQIKSGYRLIKYHNSGQRNIVNEYINYGDFTSGDYGDFVVKNTRDVYLYAPGGNQEEGILLDDAMVENLGNLNFYFYFKERLNIAVGSTDAVYDGMPKGIAQPTTSFSGIDITTYYKKNNQDEFVSTERFTNAGAYYYKCEIININYFGTVEGIFTIHKADPYITGLEVRDIIYGHPMNNAVIRCKNTDPDTSLSIAYNTTFSSDRKVAGFFSIQFPVSDSTLFQSPQQGIHDIGVVFNPSSAFNMNYNDIVFNTTLYVDYSTGLEMQFDTTSMIHTFSENTKRLARVNTIPSNQMLIYEYKRENQPDSAYTTVEPVDAGVYEVRVRTDLTISNYDNMITTEGTSLKFVINRQLLYVEAESVTAFYQNEYEPISLAYNNRIDKTFVPISDWLYQYQINGEWVTQRPVNAGNYVVKISIDSIDKFGTITGNYEGETETTLTIEKGNTNSTTSFSIVYPQPIINSAINGHISYGQKLSEIRLTQGSGYVAKYKYRVVENNGVVYYEERIVTGQFLIAERLFNPQIDASYLSFIAEMNNLILPVSRYMGNTALHMTFIPDDIVNFNISTVRVSVTVVKATPSFSNIITDDLVYGLNASKIMLVGYEKGQEAKPVFTISEIVAVNGKIVNPTVNGMPITGKFYFIDNEGRILVAGRQLINFSFTPDDENNINKVQSFNIAVNVEKDTFLLEAQEEPNSEGYITRLYGSPFYNPAIDRYKIIDGNKIIDNSLMLSFAYYNDSDEVAVMNTLTKAGLYRMVVSIENNNYQGELEEYILIEKATPTLHTTPLAGTVRYGMDMGGVILSNGKMQHPVTYYTVSGKFEFDGVPPTPTAVGEIDYNVTFIPDDLSNYKQIDLTIKIRVQKAIATITLDNLVHIYSGSIKQPSYTTNIVVRLNGEQEDYINLDDANNEFGAFDRYLDIYFHYNTIDGQIPINAGNYILTARIVDECYEGELEKVYTINQAEARIIVESQSMEQPHTGGIINLSAYAEDMQGNGIDANITQTFFYLNGVALGDTPQNVGIYTVYLEIRNINYRGNATSNLTITVSEMVVHNVEQTYGIRFPIVLEYQPLIAKPKISYQKSIGNGRYEEKTERQPTNAGIYKIVIEFDPQFNNGYSAVFEETLLINKAQVILSYDREFQYLYTGEKNSMVSTDVMNIRVAPNPNYTLNRQLLFYSAELDSFSSEQPLDVGTYRMRVIINDINYEGQAEFDYTIIKSTPIIRSNPVVNPITYTDDGSLAQFLGGEVIFNGEMKTGAYSLAVNVSNLEVGLHSVRYCFVPDDYDNLNEAYGTVQIQIIKKDIGEDIIFSGNNKVEYNTLSHHISANIAMGQNIAIDMFYNNSKSAPKEIGIYTVRAEIVDKNFQGSKEWDKKLTIVVGEPLIVLPRLSSINVGSPLSYSQIMGGYAYVNGLGEYVDGVLVEGTAVIIPGVFVFENPSTIMPYANERKARMTFKPFASNNFSNIVFDNIIKVNGINPVIGEVATRLRNEDVVYYGQSLEEFEIYFRTNNNTEGILEFIDNTVVPEVGKTVGYRFHPTNDTLYNIIEGQVSVNVHKATAEVEQIRASAFYGQTLNQALISAMLSHPFNNNITVDGHFELLSVNGFNNLEIVLTVQNVVEVATIIGDTPTAFGRYRFVSNNYNEIEGDIEVSFYSIVDNLSINVQKLSKSYNALPIISEELDINVSSTEKPLLSESFVLHIFDAKGNSSQGIEVGLYTVVIEIVDALYYGTKIVEFEVKKMDVSQYLELSHYSAEYGSNIVKPTVDIAVDFLGEVPQNNFIVAFKLITENSNSYNTTMPTRAGIYDVRITVTGNKYLSGQKELTFVIEKMAVNVNAHNHITDYNNVIPLIVNLEHNLVPTVTYFSSTYNRSTEVPTEAGYYTARIEIIHEDYTIRNGTLNYIEVSFQIRQVQLTADNNLIETPFLSDIVYGQKLKDSDISGGRVTYVGSDIEIIGHYEFEEPERKLDASVESVSLRFVPQNSNFSSFIISKVSIKVGRANAEIIFTELTAVYDGLSKKNAVRYVSSVNADWEIGFVQGGNSVDEPTDAGLYQIKIKVLGDNYQLGVDAFGTPILERSNVATFVIEKASMKNYNLPKPTAITYGQSLASSTLNITKHISAIEEDNYGLVKYHNIEEYVEGNWEYINSGLVLGDANSYIVDIIFKPRDNANFNTFKAKVKTNVLPASATITVSNNQFTYGTPITLPTFITNPGNLVVQHNIDILGQVLDCKQYLFEAWVVSPNYDAPENRIEFIIEVQKKEVELFFMGGDEQVEKYFTTYGKLLTAEAIVNIDNLVFGYEKVNRDIVLNYYSIPKNNRDVEIDYGLSVPSERGDYRVVATLNNKNYSGSKQIYYDIGFGEVDEIYFDIETLEKQVYGATIVEPIITTMPANVKYEIVYQGHTNMPTNAGSYNIVVYFNDSNYMPRQISAMFRILKKELTVEDIEVDDKVYDGVPSLAIRGRLKGVRPNDQVNIVLKATTKDNSIDVGSHKVDIVSYTLTGSSAGNYYLAKPIYNDSIYIFKRKVIDSAQQSFITSSMGFSEGVSVEFKEIVSDNNRENVVSNLFGANACVITFTIKENGLPKTLNEKIKVYVKIPDEFLNVKNLSYKGAGNLSGQSQKFVREGDYVTFYTDTSGEIIFYSKDFSYWTIGGIAVVVSIVIGIIFLLWLNPRHRRRKTADYTVANQTIARVKKGYYKK